MTLAGTEPPIGSGLFSFRNEPRLYLTPDKQAGSAQSISLLCPWGTMRCAGAMALPSAAFTQSSAAQDTRLCPEPQIGREHLLTTGPHAHLVCLILRAK